MNLKALHAKLTKEQREELANAAGIKPAYLAQIANGWQRSGRNTKFRPSLEVLKRLSEADKRLKLKDLVAEFVA